jgi:hypothetical protein
VFMLLQSCLGITIAVRRCPLARFATRELMAVNDS